MKILVTVTRKVKIITAKQAADAWWSHSAHGQKLAERTLNKLCVEGLLNRYRVLLRGPLNLETPVQLWRPGQPAPDFRAVSSTLRKRWNGTYPKPTNVYCAARKTITSLGGTGSTIPTLGQESHDVHLSTVFFRYLSKYPEMAERWVGERTLKPMQKEKEKLPDAVIFSGNNSLELVVEFGGSYNSKRCRAFHNFCQHSKNIPYEIW